MNWGDLKLEQMLIGGQVLLEVVQPDTAELLEHEVTVLLAVHLQLADLLCSLVEAELLDVLLDVALQHIVRL